jgi:lysozyme family protein
VFDAAINSGPGRSVKQLQRVLGVTEDGKLGPKTLGALERVNVATVASEFLDERESFYDGLGQAKFSKGWQNRVNKMRRLIGGDARAVFA